MEKSCFVKPLDFVIIFIYSFIEDDRAILAVEIAVFKKIISFLVSFFGTQPKWQNVSSGFLDSGQHSGQSQ